MRRAITCLAFAAMLPAHAQVTLPYEVLPGDSLYSIAERHLEDARQWPELARLNRIARPSRLVPGQRLHLPVSLLKGTATPARVEYARGTVLADGVALRIGDAVGEGSVLEVHAQGFVSLRLNDGSLLQLQSGSRSRLVRLRELPLVQRRNTLIELDRGRIEATAAPQPTGSPFRIKTPLATAGVRGTRFGVTSTEQGRRATVDLVEGQVDVQNDGSPRFATATRLAAGQGAVVSPGKPTIVKPLLQPPDLSGLAERVERLPTTLRVPVLPGAAGYRLEVADDDAFTRVLLSVEGPLPLPVEGLADGRYRLRARAIDADGLPGAESHASLRIKTTPVAPFGRAPRDGEIVAPERVDISCTEVPHARGYLLQLADDERFEAPLREQRSDERCRFELRDLPLGTLHWRVATLAAEPDGTLDRGPFGDASRFVVVPLPPAPRASEVSVNGRQVQWGGQPGMRYRVQVATDTSFTTVLQDEEVEGSQVLLRQSPRCAPHALRLQSIDAHGRRSEFSPPRLVHGEEGLCTGDGTPVERSDGAPVRVGR